MKKAMEDPNYVWKDLKSFFLNSYWVISSLCDTYIHIYSHIYIYTYTLSCLKKIEFVYSIFLLFPFTKFNKFLKSRIIFFMEISELDSRLSVCASLEIVEKFGRWCTMEIISVNNRWLIILSRLLSGTCFLLHTYRT